MSTLYSRKTKTKQLDFHQNIDCPVCNRPGSLKAYKSYRQLSVNFIPLFKYKKKWYIKTTCCGERYEISRETGEAVERKQKTSFTFDELTRGI